MPENKQQSPTQQLRTMLEGSMRAEIAKALPKDIDPDRFIRTVVTAVQMNQDLVFADRRSLLSSCMKAAQDGLMPDGREAVLNIYNTKIKVQEGNRQVEKWTPMVQYLPMVRGLLKVARNSGEIASIDAAAVYAMDRFVFKRGDDPRIEHDPYLGAEEPGPIVAAYMVVKLTNGEVHREVMTRRDLDKVRAASKSPNGPGWTTWEDQFSIKSVIKRGLKLLPQSSDRLEKLIEHDNEAMGFDYNQRGTDAAAITQQTAAPRLTDKTSSSRLSAIMGMQKQAEPVNAEQSDAAPIAGAAE